MTAMSALALHDLSQGRFVLGLGTSGPQVVEGLQGVAFRAAPDPAQRKRVEIVRLAFRGEKLRYSGRVHHLAATGRARARLCVLTIRRRTFPFFLATLAPKALEYYRGGGRRLAGAPHFRPIMPRRIGPISVAAPRRRAAAWTLLSCTRPARWRLAIMSRS